MGIFKRTLAGPVIFLNILGLILRQAGITAVWHNNRALIDSPTGLLRQADTALLFTQEKLADIDSSLEAVQDRFVNLDKIVREAGDQLDENSLTIRLISNTVGINLA
jgi:hypothetical protein